MNSSSLNLGGKSLSASSSSFNYTPSQPVSVPSPSHESNARRSASSTPSAPTSVPRKGQAARKQHREKRRPLRDSRLDDDDAMAELVSYPVFLLQHAGGGDVPASHLQLCAAAGLRHWQPKEFTVSPVFGFYGDGCCRIVVLQSLSSFVTDLVTESSP